MDFVDKIKQLADRIPNQLEYCTTEEATKNALVLPFIQALGYDVFNPTEVMPELTADIGMKKGEKVDYAIMLGGKPVIAFECKRAGTRLDDVHASQLYRYFAALSSVRFGVLTNGVEYKFYSDLEATNRMDERPFFIFDILDFPERHIAELKKFTKSSFDLDEILATASELKYTAAIKNLIAQEFDNPSDDFVRLFAKQVYSGIITQSVREQFFGITQKALRRFLNESISERLKSALEVTGQSESEEEQEVVITEELLPAEGVVREDKKRGIITTEDEIEAYFVVKSILRDKVDIKRIHLRDAKSYCTVLLDDSNRKPIFRFYFDRTQNLIGVFDPGKNEEKFPIDDVDEIYNFTDRILAAVKWYDASVGVPSQPKPSISSQTEQATNYTGKKVNAVIFQGEHYPVRSWKDAMVVIIELMRSTNSEKFEKVALSMKGTKRPYFSQDPGELRAPHLVKDTKIYVEANLSSQMIANLCGNLVDKMGYQAADDLVFEVI